MDARDAAGSGQALAARVDQLRIERRFADAEDAIRNALADEADQAALYIIWGRIDLDRYQYELALRHFEHALECDPAADNAAAWQVAVLSRLRRFTDAERLAAEHLKRFPNSVDVHIALGRVHLDQYQWQDGLHWMERAVVLNQRHASALEWRITSLRCLRRYNDAEAAAHEAVEHHPDNPELWVEFGIVYHDQYRYEEALAQYQQALRIDPNHAAGLAWRVAALRGLRRFEEAEAAVREAVERRPDDAGLWVELGIVYQIQYRYDQALAEYDQALRVDPNDAAALAWRVTALRGLRRFEEAEAAAGDAVERRPDNPGLWVEFGFVYDDQYRYDQALAEYDQALRVDPNDAAGLAWRVAALRGLRRFEEAEAAARDAVERRPDTAGLWVEFGIVYHNQYQYEEALTQYEQALRIDPNDTTALAWRVAVMSLLRRFEEAEAAAREAVERRPDDAGLWVQFGIVYHYQYQYEEALTQYEQALRIDPNDTTALELRVSALQQLRRFEEAEAAARHAVERHPDNPGPWVEFGFVYHNQYRYEEALTRYEQALSIDPSNAVALEWRMVALRRLRRFEEAKVAVREAVERRPGSPDERVQFGLIYGDQCRYGEALVQYEMALRVDPKHALALELRVTALRFLRRFDEAESAAREAVELRPDVVDLCVETGRIYDDQNEYDNALVWFEKALNLDVNYVTGIIARSVVLRSLRRFDEAERELKNAIDRLSHARELKIALAWVYHDQRSLDEAIRIFNKVRETSRSSRESAEARACLGWVQFAGLDYTSAEEYFRTACSEDGTNIAYKLGLAWSLVRQATSAGIDEAEQLCFAVLDQKSIDHSAHTCLGVLNYRRGRYAQAEQHLKKSIDLDPYHASYVDLGALYTQLSRFDEANECLKKALDRDWYDAQAHMELGHLYLQQDLYSRPSEDHKSEAVRHFRQALQIEPTSGSASLGLALALAQQPGDLVTAEAILQEALRRPDSDQPRWQLLLAVSRLLIERGDATQGRQFFIDALAYAQEAISLASEESEPFFVAAVARHKLAEVTSEFPMRPFQRRMAVRDLRRCTRLDPANIEAQRSLSVLEESLRATRASTTASGIVVIIGAAILSALWTAFLFSGRVTTIMLTTLTPVMVGLIVVGLLLPFLVRLKLPGGVEADLSASIRQISSGPTGEESFGPGRFSTATASTGPKGQIPRRE